MSKPTKLPTKLTYDEDGDPLPYTDGDSVYMPMFGKYNMACMDALLKSYSDPPKTPRKRKPV